MLSGSMVVQAWASLTSFGTVCFEQIWVGNGTGRFDSKGSSKALSAVVDVRGDGYTHVHGEMVQVRRKMSMSQAARELGFWVHRGPL